MFGNEGIVVEISFPEGESTQENHGGISVWLKDKCNYGLDNCEHYTIFNWQKVLKIIDSEPTKENTYKISSRK